MICFEPIPESYAILERRFGTKVKCVQKALGAYPGVVLMESSGPSDMAHVSDFGTTQVDVITLDSLLLENLSYLKIDVEGYEMEVLKGAAKTLSVTHFVEIEVSMNPDNTHTPFELAKALLEKANFRLFGIYEQIHEHPAQLPCLRRANALFCRKTVELKNERLKTSC